MTPTEQKLRELCAYYEWSEPADVQAADTLQGAADALRDGELSEKAARAIAAVWGAFVGAEAAVGNEPAYVSIAGTEDELQRSIVSDFRRMISREQNTARRLHLTQLMQEQIERFAEGLHHD